MAKTFTVKPISKKKEAADEILLQAVIKYKELQAKLVFNSEQLRKEMEAPRRIIEAACLAADDNKIITPEFRASFVENKSLDAEAMISALGRKRLAPYITERIDKEAVTKALGEDKVKPFLVPTGVRQLRVS